MDRGGNARRGWSHRAHGAGFRQLARRSQRPKLPDLHPSEFDSNVANLSDDARQGGEIVLATGGFRRIRHTCTLPGATDIHLGKPGPELTLCTT
jgi:hypothetical protein